MMYYQKLLDSYLFGINGTGHIMYEFLVFTILLITVYLKMELLLILVSTLTFRLAFRYGLHFQLERV